VIGVGCTFQGYYGILVHKSWLKYVESQVIHLKDRSVRIRIYPPIAEEAITGMNGNYVQGGSRKTNNRILHSCVQHFYYFGPNFVGSGGLCGFVVALFSFVN